MQAVRNRAAAERPEWRLAAANPDDPAIDLVHLARQTDGDAALEAELLGMFDRQAAVLLTRLTPARGRESCMDILHKLRGSALAIGARRVAFAAQDFEAVLDSGLACPRERERALDGVAAAVAEARGLIAQWLG